MKRTLISLLTASIAAALVACSGGKTVPEAGPNSAPALAQASTTCNVAGFWYLKGSCDKANLTSAGGTFALAAYRGITVKLVLGKNTASTKDTFFFSDATGSGDVTGRNGGVKFKPYSSGACLSGFTCPGSAIVYFSNINKGQEVGLLGRSSAAISDQNGLAGKSLCFPAVATPKGWLADVAIGVKPKANAFTIRYPADKLFLPTGQLVVAYACE